MEKGKLELARAMTNMALARTYDDVLAGILWGEMEEYLKQVESGEKEDIPEEMMSLLSQSDVSYLDATMRMKLERFKKQNSIIDEKNRIIKEKEDRIIHLDGRLTLAKANVERLEKLNEELKQALYEKSAAADKKAEKKKSKKTDKPEADPEPATSAEAESAEPVQDISEADAECAMLVAVLERNKWKMIRAAIELRMTTGKLKRLMEEYGIEKPKK